MIDELDIDDLLEKLIKHITTSRVLKKFRALGLDFDAAVRHAETKSTHAEERGIGE
jgi:hypothetical protein